MTETCTVPSMEATLLQKAAEVLKTVAHPVRLRIIDILDKGERSVTDLCGCLGTPQAYTSQQLNLMKAKGVLASRRNGNQMIYSIANPSVVKIIHCVRQQAQGGGEAPPAARGSGCLTDAPGVADGEGSA